MTTLNVMFSMIHVDEKPDMRDSIYQDMYQSATCDYPQTFTVERFLRMVKSGFPFLAAYLRPDYSPDRDERRGDRFIACWLYVLDFDNKEDILPLEDALEIARSQDLYEPLFWYTTFSHTDERPRYRIGFRVKQELMTREEHKVKFKELNAVFGNKADKQCLHPERLFQGTRPDALCGGF